MRNTKRTFFGVLIAICCLLCAIALAACGGSTVDYRISLDQTTVELDVHEQIRLIADATKDGVGTDEITWSSSNESTATVSDGLVITHSAGTATIMAKCGDAAAECTVTVKDSQTAPVLTLDRNEITVPTEGTLTVRASVTYKNAAPVEMPSITWAYAENAAQDIVSFVSETDGKVLITGLKEGETVLQAGAVLWGIPMTQSLRVTVRNTNITFELANAIPTSGGWQKQLYLSQQGDESEFTPVLTVKHKDVTVENPQIVWNSNDSDKVAVASDGKITALKTGNVRVIGTCTVGDDTASVAIDVNVKQIVSGKVRYAAGLSHEGDVLSVASGTYQGTVDGDGNYMIALTAGEHTLTMTSALFGVSEKKITVEDGVFIEYNFDFPATTEEEYIAGTTLAENGNVFSLSAHIACGEDRPSAERLNLPGISVRTNGSEYKIVPIVWDDGWTQVRLYKSDSTTVKYYDPVKVLSGVTLSGYDVSVIFEKGNYYVSVNEVLLGGFNINSLTTLQGDTDNGAFADLFDATKVRTVGLATRGDPATFTNIVFSDTLSDAGDRLPANSSELISDAETNAANGNAFIITAHVTASSVGDVMPGFFIKTATAEYKVIILMWADGWMQVRLFKVGAEGFLMLGSDVAMDPLVVPADGYDISLRYINGTYTAKLNNIVVQSFNKDAAFGGSGVKTDFDELFENETVKKLGIATVGQAATFENIDYKFNTSEDIFHDFAVSLSETTASMDVHERLTLTATATKDGEATSVVWASSDESVATVENGVITSLTAGTTVISATAGNVTAKCTVTVTNSGATPSIVLDATSLNLNKQGHADVSASILYKNAPAIDTATITWAFAEGSATDVVSFTQDADGKVTVTGLKGGTATLKATATLWGHSLEQTLTVTVNETEVIIAIANLEQMTGGWKVTLSTSGLGDVAKTILPSVSVTVDSSPVSNPVINWRSENAEVASVGTDGTITAVKAGTAQIKGVYTYGQNESDKVEFTVFVSVKNILSGSVAFVATNPKGSNVTVTCGEKTVSVEEDGSYHIELPDGEQTLTFTCDEYVTVEKTVTVDASVSSIEQALFTQVKAETVVPVPNAVATNSGSHVLSVRVATSDFGEQMPGFSVTTANAAYKIIPILWDNDAWTGLRIYKVGGGMYSFLSLDPNRTFGTGKISYGNYTLQMIYASGKYWIMLNDVLFSQFSQGTTFTETNTTVAEFAELFDSSSKTLGVATRAFTAAYTEISYTDMQTAGLTALGIGESAIHADGTVAANSTQTHYISAHVSTLNAEDADRIKLPGFVVTTATSEYKIIPIVWTGEGWQQIQIHKTGTEGYISFDPNLGAPLGEDNIATLGYDIALYYSNGAYRIKINHTALKPFTSATFVGADNATAFAELFDGSVEKHFGVATRDLPAVFTEVQTGTLSGADVQKMLWAVPANGSSETILTATSEFTVSTTVSVAALGDSMPEISIKTAGAEYRIMPLVWDGGNNVGNALQLRIYKCDTNGQKIDCVFFNDTLSANIASVYYQITLSFKNGVFTLTMGGSQITFDANTAYTVMGGAVTKDDCAALFTDAEKQIGFASSQFAAFTETTVATGDGQ